MKAVELLEEMRALAAAPYRSLDSTIADVDEARARELLDARERGLFDKLLAMREKFRQVPPIARTESAYNEAVVLYRGLLEPFLPIHPEWFQEIKDGHPYFF